MAISPATLNQKWPLPTNPRPIVIIGAGGIVNDSHLPAYVMGNLPVAGVFDIDPQRSAATADRFKIPRVFSTVEEAIATQGVVFDIAVPPKNLYDALARIPAGSAVLMQKPMGIDLRSAYRIRQLCHERRLTAAVNFQLRYSPMMLVVRDLFQRGLIGEIYDIDIDLNYREPWEMFPFLFNQPRVEMLIASIHYFDWVRSIAGDPMGVYAKSISHPRFPNIEATRTTAILDYGSTTRCCLSLNDTWLHGPQQESCTIRVDGSKGAVVVTLGCLMGYPNGRPDEVEFITDGMEWTKVPLWGSWFPHAFLGTMCNIQRFAAGEDDVLCTNVDDAFKTMKLIEALYESNEHGAVRVERAEST
jgi:predicted dehydrogenase